MSKLAKITNVLVGADVEVFLQDKETKEIVSAEGYVKGTKYEPFNFDPSSPFFAISLDNVAAEFCIPPAKSPNEWVDNMLKSLSYINQSIPERFCTVAEPAAILDERFLQTQNAKLFGCEPDYNVYLRDLNPKPTATNSSLRSCGGHVHVGYDDASDDSSVEGEGLFVKEAIIKAMDLFVGVPSVLQEPDNDRKKLYGKAGAFRFKSYGVEYRTVSNYYLKNEELMKWVFSNTMKAVDFLNNGGFEHIESVAELVQDAINNCNKVAAGNLIRQFNIETV